MKEDKYFLTDRGLIGEIKYPDSDDITKNQENYIKLYFNTMETNMQTSIMSVIPILDGILSMPTIPMAILAIGQCSESRS